MVAGPALPRPRFGRLYETFAGSACYALHHHRRDVVLIERDPVIAELWRYLIRVTPEEVLALPDLAPGQSTDDLEVCPAARSLIGLWSNQGTPGGRKRASSWAKSPERARFFWGPRAHHRIARQLPAIRHWTVVEGEAMATTIHGAATWFIDPPYQGRPGSHYRYGSKLIDYGELAEWVTVLPGQVIACEQLGADWLPFERLGRVNGQRGASTEVIWCSDRRDSPGWRQPGLFEGAA